MEMYIKHKKIKIFIYILVPVTFIIGWISKLYPNILEIIYSNGINRYTRIVLSNVMGIFPFSVSEILIVVGILVLFIMTIKLIKALFIKSGLNELSNIVLFLSLLYILFMFLWGFNYNRNSFDELIGLSVREYTNKELTSLCVALIDETNSIRELISENESGVMITEGNYKEVIKRASVGYDKLSERIPQLKGSYGKPKPLLISNFMMYTGITGIYIPYTAEANINIRTDNYSLPHVVAHEMAHQRGFSLENEANYIAYLACMESPYIDFNYSGIVTALIYSMNELRKNDYSTYSELRNNYSEAVQRDLVYGYEYWQQYEGPVEKAATTVNNTYLKSNGMVEGVKSYGKMVDLLLAYYLESGKLY